jgi:aspartate aminotransferase
MVLEIKMFVSDKMQDSVNKGSMIRAMFEEGIALKRKHGANEVFDYSLGNPDLEPPKAFTDSLINILQNKSLGSHGYMPNAGLVEARSALAKYLSEENKEEFPRSFSHDNIIMTVGAAGGINCVLKAILNPGDEVIALAPYFVEYGFYVDNHNGIIKVAETTDKFRPDPDNLAKAITSKTRALIINTPNNPTGAVYTAEELKTLGDVLLEANKKLKAPIVLIADEPYRQIVFNGTKVPSVFASYPYTIVVTSFSKDLSIPGERLGYVTLSPLFEQYSSDLFLAITLANRILGSVNAPALIQRAIVELLYTKADLTLYEIRSKFLSKALIDMGYELTPAEGTFYLFPKSPIPNDLEFMIYLKDELILAVPGVGFQRHGYFRLSLCIDEVQIEKSLKYFKDAKDKALSGVRKPR